jgi:hypothetical protein
VVYADFHVTGSLGDAASGDRFRDYGGGGTPTTWVDGRRKLSGGNDAANRYQEAYMDAASDSSVLSLQVRSQYDPSGRQATVQVIVEIAEDVTRFEECLIQVVLVEDQVVSRERTFDRTVRMLLSPQPLVIGEAGRSQSIVQRVAIPSGWDPGELSAVAWVHRSLPNPDSSREVLNAAQSQVFGATPILEVSWGGIKSLWR